MDRRNYLFLIGAPKAGTSSVARALGQHPDVCVSSVKEPMYFTDFAERTWTGYGSEGMLRTLTPTRAAYEATFAHDPAASWRVDASTDYLHCPVAPERIAAFAREPGVGQVRVAVLLRDPVDRAISQYQHTVRDGFETGTLREALSREAERIAAGHHPLYYHVARSRYHGAVAAWKQRFPTLMVLDYHELLQGGRVIESVLLAMGLAPAAPPEIPHENASRVYKNRMLGVAMRTRGPMIEAARRLVPPPLRRALRERLVRWNEVQYVPDRREVDALRLALSDDIAACLDDPSIPTTNWRTAPGEGQAARSSQGHPDLREHIV